MKTDKMVYGLGGFVVGVLVVAGLLLKTQPERLVARVDHGDANIGGVCMPSELN